MATLGAFTDAVILVGGFDLTADSNEVSVEFSAETVDATSFGDGARKRMGGLQTGTISGGGHFNAGANKADEALFNLTGTNDTPVVVFPNGITAGTTTERGYAMQGVVSEYNFGGTVGAMTPFSFTVEGSGIS